MLELAVEIIMVISLNNGSKLLEGEEGYWLNEWFKALVNFWSEWFKH